MSYLGTNKAKAQFLALVVDNPAVTFKRTAHSRRKAEFGLAIAKLFSVFFLILLDTT